MGRLGCWQKGEGEEAVSSRAGQAFKRRRGGLREEAEPSRGGVVFRREQSPRGSSVSESEIKRRSRRSSLREECLSI